MRHLLLLTLMALPASAQGDTLDRSPAEVAVAERIAQDGIHIVHFWAPWCDNSLAEFERGWYEVIENHPDVSFTFVTVWSDGAAGRDILQRYGIPSSVDLLILEDPGPSTEPENRIRRFMDLPMTWIPTTWVFHRNGQLAFAFNYGELEMSQLERAIADVRRDW